MVLNSGSFTRSGISAHIRGTDNATDGQTSGQTYCQLSFLYVLL